MRIIQARACRALRRDVAAGIAQRAKQRRKRPRIKHAGITKGATNNVAAARHGNTRYARVEEYKTKRRRGVEDIAAGTRFRRAGEGACIINAPLCGVLPARGVSYLSIGWRLYFTH